MQKLGSGHHGVVSQRLLGLLGETADLTLQLPLNAASILSGGWSVVVKLACTVAPVSNMAQRLCILIFDSTARRGVPLVGNLES